MPSPAGDTTSTGTQENGRESSAEPIVVSDDGSEDQFRCRCTGMTFDAECQYRATQEDRLCDRCRIAPGQCCEDKKDPATQYTRKLIYDIEKEYPLPWHAERNERLRQALEGWDQSEWEEVKGMDQEAYAERYRK